VVLRLLIRIGETLVTLEENSMRSLLILVSLVAATVATSQCGGNGGGTPQTPTTPTTPPSTVTVSIVGTRGNASYVPNPVPVSGSEQVIFRNNDTVAHRIMMDNGSADFGNLSPGSSSQARSVSSGNFHCTTHPSMVGSIGGTTPPAPPPGSGDGY
jgi:plastocyanin